MNTVTILYCLIAFIVLVCTYKLGYYIGYRDGVEDGAVIVTEAGIEVFKKLLEIGIGEIDINNKRPLT